MLYTALISMAIIVIPFVVNQLSRHQEKKEYINSGIKVVDRMTGEEFEEVLLCHFRNLGYKGHPTPTTGDYGADLVLEKDGVKIVLQAKRYTEKVGNFIHKYNFRKLHSVLGYQTPAENYYPVLLGMTA